MLLSGKHAPLISAWSQPHLVRCHEPETLAHASAILDHVVAQIQHTPSSTWLGAVDKARSDALKQLTPLTKTISSADLAVQTPYPNPRALARAPLRALLQRAFDGAPPQA